MVTSSFVESPKPRQDGRKEAKYPAVLDHPAQGNTQGSPRADYITAKVGSARLFSEQPPPAEPLPYIEQRSYVLPMPEELSRDIQARGAAEANNPVFHYGTSHPEFIQRQKVESLLLASEQKFQTLFESVPMGSALQDLQGRYIETNSAYQRMLGYTADELFRTPLEQVIHPEDLPRVHRLFAEMAEGKRNGLREESRYLHKDGHIVSARTSASVARNARGEVTYILSMVEDMTERNQGEAEMRRLSRRIIETQETERHRMARDLHYGVNQMIASAKMRLRKVEEAIPALNPAAKEILARCGQLLVRALEENRRIAHNLRPTELDELGLAAACRNLCKEIELRAGIRIKCRITRSTQNWGSEVELNLFRIVQEALNNVQKYASARTVTLSLCVRPGAIVLLIQDDGQGFNALKAKCSKLKGHGAGFTNMRERAASLGGECIIDSLPGRGTRITVQVPWKEAAR